MNPRLQAAARWGLRVWGRSGVRPGWFYQAMETYGPRLAHGPLPTRLPTGQRLTCDLTDHVQRHLYYYGVYEPVEAHIFWLLLKPGMVVVDAGANIGQYSLLASAGVGPHGVVHSFEPVPGNFERLERTLIENGVQNVRLNRVALWHEPTELNFGLPDGASDNLGSFTVRSGGEVRSPAVRFDDDMTIGGPVGLVKMDIEGAELFALRGMMTMLTRDRPYLLMEVNRAACERLGYEPAELWQLLVNDLGYTAWAIEARGCKPLATVEGIAQANVLFTSGTLPERVRGGCGLRKALRWLGTMRGRLRG